MKKLCTLLIILIAIQFVFGQNNCNDSIPGWGESLGEITFKTDRIWTVGNQEWSDVVMASACRKEIFDGGKDVIVVDIEYLDGGGSTEIEGTYNADCRSVQNGKNHLFSWCAIIRFQEKLCPAPWRVPTYDDFTILNIELTGSESWYGSQAIFDKYLNHWGASQNQWCFGNGELFNLHPYSEASYWSLTSKPHFAFNLYISSNIYYFSNGTFDKARGVSLRCVRDK